MPTDTPIKIAMIGAGSVGFTRRLMQDVLAVPELQSAHFALMDISERNLEMVRRLCQRDIDANGLPATLSATLERGEAVADADYVVCTIRQGGLEAFGLDIDIPLRYGVDQCVGDTLCAGGLMYAQRSIPALLELCADIRAHARPGARLLNYANPMAMNTWACSRYGGVETIGLCHGVQHGHAQIAGAIERWARAEGRIDPEERVTRDDVAIVCAGINHQTWYLRVLWRGEEMTGRLLGIYEADPVLREQEKVRIDVLRRFGYYSTESNGHLSEYLPWYRKRPQEVADWIDPSDWHHGETGGYLRHCRERRDWFETDYPQWLAADPPAIGPENRSVEHGSRIVEALETGRPYRGHFNVVNRGHIANLPDGCIVEIPGWVDTTGINMPTVGELPLACAATCAASVRVQQMGMEAAVRGDVTLLKQAMLHDPLVAAVCTPEEVWQMTDELLVAQARWLPTYSQAAIAAARERLERHEAEGTRVPPREGVGLTRRPERDLDTLRREAREAATRREPG